MIEELRDIARDLDRLRGRVEHMIQLLEKRRIRLSVLTDEEVIGEAADRTLPATDITEILELEKSKPRKDKR